MTREVDWPALHARLALAAARSEESLHPSAARIAKVLDERARLLARPLGLATSTRDAIELLVCVLGVERCAIEPRAVLHVGRAPRVTSIPGVPSPFVGIGNHAGDVIPVIDLGAVLDLPLDATRAAILVIGDRRAEMGMLVDEALEVITVDRSEIAEAPSQSSSPKSDALIRGVLPGGISVIDVQALLRSPRLFVSPP